MHHDRYKGAEQDMNKWEKQIQDHDLALSAVRYAVNKSDSARGQARSTGTGAFRR